ncbi:hypothetical protein AKO1_000834, partial [Acrasis kona]
MKGSLFTALILSLVAWATCQTETPYTELGVPTNGTVASQKLNYYVLDIDTLFKDVQRSDVITFALTSFVGDADLFISTTGRPDVVEATHQCRNCILQGSTPRSEVQQISKDSPQFPSGAGQKFYIGILGYASGASYYFNSFSDRATITDGHPQTGQTKRGKFVYFTYTRISNDPFVITVTPFSGDPDLYISQTTITPGPGSSTWSASSTGDDTITIDPSEPPAATSSVYYIGVRAFTDAYYTIYASSVKTYTQTVEGVPLYERLPASQTALFKTTVLQPQYLTVKVNPRSYRGDPDIYVTKSVEQGPPGPGNYLYAKTTVGDDELTFKAEPTTYYIGIKAYTTTTDFEVIVTSEHHSSELIDGTSLRGNNTDETTLKYYKFVNTDPENGLTVSVVPEGESSVSDFRLYAARNNAQPGPAKHEEEAVADPQNPGFKSINYNAPTQVGAYYLGVQGRGHFRVLANTNVSYTHLRDSEQVYGVTIGADMYKYFIFDAADFATQDFAVVVSPLEGGDVDLYVSIKDPKPKTSSYTWHSMRYGHDTVFIPSKDPKAESVVAPRFFVGVHNPSSSARRFNIRAFQSGYTQEIEDGVDVRGVVGIGESKHNYYVFRTPIPGMITIGLQLDFEHDSDADIYVSSTVEKPTRDHSDYKSIDFGNDVISIENSYYTTYYIAIAGVYAGIKETTPDGGIAYTLSVQQNYHRLSTYTTTVPMSVTKQDAVMQFKVPIYRGPENILVSLTLVSGRTRLFVNMNGTDATPQNHQLMKWGWPSNTMLIPTNDARATNGLWSIGVQALEPSSYYLRVTTPPDEANLQPSVPHVFAVGSKKINYYRFQMQQHSSKQNNTLSLRVMDGRADVYVNYFTNYYEMIKPSRQNYTLKIENRNSGILTLPSEEYSGLYVHVAVYGGDYEHNYFSLLLNTGNDYQILLDDQPQEHRTRANNDYNRFEVIKSYNKAKPIIANIGIESCDLNPAPLVYVSRSKKNVTDADKDVASHNPFDMPYMKDVNVNEKHDYIQVAKITQEAGQHEKVPSFYLAVRSPHGNVGSAYSIYTTTREERRPIHKNDDHLRGTFQDDKLTLHMDNATVTVNPHKKLFYDLYVYIPRNVDNAIVRQANLFTICGVKSYSRHVATYTGSDLPSIAVPQQ